jgi:hypothetical protein
MGENAWVKSAGYTVTAHDFDPVFPCLNEIIVQQDLPLSIENLAMAERKEGVTRGMCARCLF